MSFHHQGRPSAIERASATAPARIGFPSQVEGAVLNAGCPAHVRQCEAKIAPACTAKCIQCGVACSSGGLGSMLGKRCLAEQGGPKFCSEEQKCQKRRQVPKIRGIMSPCFRALGLTRRKAGAKIHGSGLEGYPSGQRDQTVNLTALPSKVRILLPPPNEVAVAVVIGSAARYRFAGVAQW